MKTGKVMEMRVYKMMSLYKRILTCAILAGMILLNAGFTPLPAAYAAPGQPAGVFAASENRPEFSAAPVAAPVSTLAPGPGAGSDTGSGANSGANSGAGIDTIPQKGFTDLRDWYWAYNDIKKLVMAGLINGYADGEFKPERRITRGEFAELLARTLEKATAAAASSSAAAAASGAAAPEKIPPINKKTDIYDLPDLSQNDRIYPYAISVMDYLRPRRAKVKGMLYEADAPLLRSEAAEALIRILNLQNELTDVSVLNIFSDSSTIDSLTSRRYAAIAVQRGIFVGSEGGTLDLGGPVGRAEACALLLRTLQAAQWGGVIEFPSEKIYVPDADSGFYNTFFDDAVFVGDSITQGLGIYVLNQRSRGQSPLGAARFLTAVSYSIRASASDNYRNNTINLSWQGQKMSIEDCLAAMEAKELYIMLGVNDGVGSNLDYYRDLYEKAMTKIIANNPELIIRVQSCTPVTKSREKSTLNNKNLDSFNILLKELCESSGYDYLDISSALKGEDNGFNPDYSSDKYVHMNNEGSKAWINALYEFARQQYIGGEWRPDADPEEYPGIWMDIDIWQS